MNKTARLNSFCEKHLKIYKKLISNTQKKNNFIIFIFLSKNLLFFNSKNKKIWNLFY